MDKRGTFDPQAFSSFQASEEYTQPSDNTPHFDDAQALARHQFDQSYRVRTASAGRPQHQYQPSNFQQANNSFPDPLKQKSREIPHFPERTTSTATTAVQKPSADHSQNDHELMEKLKASLAKEESMKKQIKTLNNDHAALQSRMDILTAFETAVSRHTSEIFKYQNICSLLSSLSTLDSTHATLVNRNAQIEKLRALEVIQQSAIHHLRIEIEKEKEGLREEMAVLHSARHTLDSTMQDEEAMLIELLATSEKKRELETKQNKETQQQVEKLNKLVQKHKKMNEKVKKKLADKKLYVKNAILDGLGKSVMQVMQLLLAELMRIMNESAEAKLKIKKLIDDELRINSVQEAEVELDKVKPDWTNPQFHWPITCIMELIKWVPPAVTKSVFDVVAANSIQEIGIAEEKVMETIKMMKKPFSEGSYRLAIYGLGSGGTKYSLKQFKFSGGFDIDYEYAEKQCLYHTFCSMISENFNYATKKAGLQYTISFVNSYVGKRRDNNCVYMLEPLLPKFAKWTNNVDYIANSFEGDMMAAFSHYTYIHSQGSFMITDLQGCVELLSKSAVKNFNDDVVRSNASGGGSRANDATCGGEGPFVDRYRFTLTDPAILFLAEQGQCGLLDQIRSDEAGDMGIEGRDLFFQAHRPKCGDICRALGLAK